MENPVKVKEESYRHISKLYLEGIYDQNVGSLYLIGCRKVSFDHVDLERGLDCLIEVTINYSPVNTRWLINPTATITIISQRNETDIYHFRPVYLQTFMLHDRNHQKNVIFRKNFEGYLRVFLLLVIVAHILHQMKKMKKSRELVYVSFVMLGFWIIGYGFSLIYRKEILINSSESQSYINQPYNHQSYELYLKTLDYFARFLVLVSLFLMAKVSQMVWKARKVLRDEGESIPSEKKVLSVSFGVYICYLFLKIIERRFYLDPVQGRSTKDVYMKLTMDVLRYEVGVLQDYLMIPQIIAFRIWKPRVSDGLLRSFFTSLLIPSLVLFVYEIVRDPVAYPV